MFIKFEESPEKLYRNNGIEIIGSFKDYEDLLSGSAIKIEVSYGPEEEEVIIQSKEGTIP